MTQIVQADLDDPRLIALLGAHRSSALLATPGGLNVRAPNITFWAAWNAGTPEKEVLLGVGALRALSRDHGEVKSMHTAEPARRRGVGSMMLRHIVGAGRERGYSRISLETGSKDVFAPARAFYRSHGFQECGPFGAYALDPRSVFMTMDLS